MKAALKPSGPPLRPVSGTVLALLLAGDVLAASFFGPVGDGVDRVRRGEPVVPSNPSQVLIPPGVRSTSVGKAAATAINQATPAQVKHVIQGGQRLTDSAVKALQDTAGVTLQQAARQAEFIVGTAQASLTCVTETNKCGRELNKAREDVDKLSGEELQWAGRRMVAIGQLTTQLHEEMKLLHGEMLEAYGQVQDAAFKLKGFGSDLDPVTRGLDGFDRILGDPGLKDSYQKFVKDNQNNLTKLQQQTFKLPIEAGDDAGIALGNFMQDSGAAVERFGYYIAVSSAGFPEALLGAPPVLSKGEKASIAVGVSSLALNQLLDGLQSERFAMGKSAKKPADNKEYVEIRSFEASFDPGFRTIMVVASDARIRARVADSVQSVKVKTLRVQLVPALFVSQKPDGTYDVWLTFKPRALHVDVANLPTRMDQALTYVLNDTALKDTLRVNLSTAMAPIVRAASTRLDGGDIKKQVRQATFVPTKLDFIVEPTMFTLRTAGRFERIADANN